MRKKLFLILALVALSLLFLSFIDDIKVIGFVIKNVNPCLEAEKNFLLIKSEYICDVNNEEICKNLNSTMIYRYENGVKEWTFFKENKYEKYVYDLTKKQCKVFKGR